MKKLLKLFLVAGAVAGVAKMVMMKREWSGLTETQVREKIDSGLSRKVDDASKRQEIADKVVGAMKDKGVIKEDPVPDVTAEAPDSGDTNVTDIKEAG